jgi:hypothetical protein
MNAQLLDAGALAALLGFSRLTVHKYLWESHPGGRYSDHPFPTPDGRIGRSPYWNPDRVQEIQQWAAGRKGRGVGGGPKPKAAA